jgi:hypothetical protein
MMFRELTNSLCSYLEYRLQHVFSELLCGVSAFLLTPYLAFSLTGEMCGNQKLLTFVQGDV